MAKIQLTVNKKRIKVVAQKDTPLLWVLRDELNLKGTKYGCGKGLCGSCTVHVDGKAMRSCTVTMDTVAGKKITTIEGLANEDHLHPVQSAWLIERVPQCGYCQAGQIMTASALLDNNPSPNEKEIDEGMAGNICRCGTYPRIKKAISSVIKGGLK